MHKYLLIIILFLLQFSLLAQIKFGVKAGGQLSDQVLVSSSKSMKEFKKTWNDQYNYKISYHVGGYTNIGLSPKFAAQVELLYSNKGYFSPNNSDLSMKKFRSNFHYLNLPILFVYKPLNKLSFSTGLELGYLLAARTVSEDGRSKIIESFTKDFDLGAVVGADYFITKSLSCGVRYIYGLANVLEADFTDENAESVEARVQNRTIQLSVGYTFGK